MMTTDLIEALVKLCDEFCQLHRVYGPTAFSVIEDLHSIYSGQEARGAYTPRHRVLIEQAEGMLRRHYAIDLNADILEKLMNEMDKMEDAAND